MSKSLKVDPICHFTGNKYRETDISVYLDFTGYFQEVWEVYSWINIKSQILRWKAEQNSFSTSLYNLLAFTGKGENKNDLEWLLIIYMIYIQTNVLVARKKSEGEERGTKGLYKLTLFPANGPQLEENEINSLS